MKKLLMTCLTVSGVSLAFAAGDMKKIDTDFESLDNDGDQYISKEEADDNNIWDHFTKIDSNQDGRLSSQEYQNYIRQNPDMVEEGEDLTDSTR